MPPFEPEVQQLAFRDRAFDGVDQLVQRRLFTERALVDKAAGVAGVNNNPAVILVADQAGVVLVEKHPDAVVDKVAGPVAVRPVEVVNVDEIGVRVRESEKTIQDQKLI